MNTLHFPSENEQKILILGAYGLIGYGIANRLQTLGYGVTGLGRNAGIASRVLPDIHWVISDITELSEAEDWTPLLDDVSAVVNCSGALQDGPEDDLEAVHHHSVAALATACEAAGIPLIQISAVGAVLDAPTQFLSSKARGDAAIRTSGVVYYIFRPGLVLAPQAYGGTAMLRMLAAVPLLQPVAMPDAQIQTVSLADLAEAVVAALSGKLPPGSEADLVETNTHRLREVLGAVRNWLGFGPAVFELNIPEPLARAVSKIADHLSALGWRSPLRTTAFAILADGIKGDPAEWGNLGLRPMSSMTHSLAATPATASDRLFARMALLTPVLIVTLFSFWLTSGLVSLAQANDAAKVLENVGWPHIVAVSSVVFWAVVDIAIAGAIAVRKTAKAACWAMILVSCFYLAASTFFVPHLWIDPLGPLTKVVPGILLALVTRVALETR